VAVVVGSGLVGREVQGGEIVVLIVLGHGIHPSEMG
jgi:hypothetical protein